jgi:O-antigen/teichoic acid export membrane protein
MLGLTSERFLRLSKEGSWIVLGQALFVAASLVGVRMLTGLMNPAAYGELALEMTAANMLTQTVLGPLGNGATRFYAPSVERGELRAFLSATRTLLARSVGALAVLMLFVAAGLLAAGHLKWLLAGLAVFAFAVFNGSNYILSGIQDAARQRSIVALHQGMAAWAQYLFAAGLIVWLGATSTVAMLGYAIAAFMVLGSQFFFFRATIARRAAGPGDDGTWRGKILEFTLPVAAWSVFTWAQFASDRWALGLFRPMQELGVYTGLFQIGYSPIYLLTSMGLQLMAPIYYQRAGDASDSRRNANVNRLNWRLTKLALGLTGACSLAGFLFHTQIFSVFVAQEYRGVSYLMPWLTLAAGLFATGQIISMNLMAQMKTKLLMKVKIVTSVFGISMNFLGAYLFGVKGVVMAITLFSLAYFLWMLGLLNEDGRALR